MLAENRQSIGKGIDVRGPNSAVAAASESARSRRPLAPKLLPPEIPVQKHEVQG